MPDKPFVLTEERKAKLEEAMTRHKEPSLYPEVKETHCPHCGVVGGSMMGQPQQVGPFDGVLVACGECGALLSWVAIGMRVPKPEIPLVVVPK